MIHNDNSDGDTHNNATVSVDIQQAKKVDPIYQGIAGKRVNSNNDIFERDVQMEYFPTSPVSMGKGEGSGKSWRDIKQNLEVDPKSSGSEAFFIMTPEEKESRSLEKKQRRSSNSTNMFNTFSFGSSPERKNSRTHGGEKASSPMVENALMKVPTHVLSVDNYINSDMDEKCCKEKPHSKDEECCTEPPRAKKEGDEEDCEEDAENSDDFDERMEYFDHRQSSFDNYLNELNGKKADKKLSKLSKLFKKSHDSKQCEEDRESNETIDNLTTEVLKSHIRTSDIFYLDEEEYEKRRLNRERSRSLTSIIVKGLSDSFK